MDDLTDTGDATDAQSRIFDMKAVLSRKSARVIQSLLCQAVSQVANLRLRAELQRIRSCEQRSRDRTPDTNT